MGEVHLFSELSLLSLDGFKESVEAVKVREILKFILEKVLDTGVRGFGVGSGGG